MKECENCKALQSARDYIRILEKRAGFIPAFASGVDEAMLEDYISLANQIDGFIDLYPDHPLYESIRKDIKKNLERIKR